MHCEQPATVHDARNFRRHQLSRRCTVQRQGALSVHGKGIGLIAAVQLPARLRADGNFSGNIGLSVVTTKQGGSRLLDARKTKFLRQQDSVSRYVRHVVQSDRCFDAPRTVLEISPPKKKHHGGSWFRALSTSPHQTAAVHPLPNDDAVTR